MQKFVSDLKPRDVIAFLIIIGAIITNWRGGSIMVPATVMLVIGFYFGSAHETAKQDVVKDANNVNEKL